jgi:hypothetical protein
MEYLALMQVRLAAASTAIRTEAVDCGLDGGLKVSRQRVARSPPALIKYSPPYFTLVSVTGGASLSIMVLTHTEELIEEVDFKVEQAVMSVLTLCCRWTWPSRRTRRSSTSCCRASTGRCSAVWAESVQCSVDRQVQCSVGR